MVLRFGRGGSMRALLLVSVVAWGGCDEGAATVADLAVADLEAPVGPDLRPVPSPIGGPCTSNASCDPTAGDGTCTTSARKPGGCLRFAYGLGKTGFCFGACGVGPGSCPPVSGAAQHCVVFDERGYTDAAASGPDRFVGGICENV